MQDIEPGHTGQVDARATGRSRLDIRTVHVRRLRLLLSDRLVDPGRVLVVVNGAAREIRFAPSMVEAITTYRESGADPAYIAHMVVDLDIPEVLSEEGGNADAGRDAQAVDAGANVMTVNFSSAGDQERYLIYGRTASS